jgi:peptidoglycan hydrolase-like protein with peptidoglycan-binding domain
MINALRNPKKNPKNTTFNILVDKILAKNPQDIRLDLLKEYAKGEITDDELNMLHIFNQNMTKETLEKLLPKKNFLQTISFWTDEYAQQRPEIKAQMFKEYIQRVNAGEDPQIAVNTIITEKTKQNLVSKTPGMGNLPKGKGQLMVDAYGNRAIVYPDGTIEELSKGVKE